MKSETTNTWLDREDSTLFGVKMKFETTNTWLDREDSSTLCLRRFLAVSKIEKFVNDCPV